MDLCEYFAIERIPQRVQEGMQILLGTNPECFDNPVYNERELTSGQRYMILDAARKSIATELRYSGSTHWRAGRMANELMDDIIGYRVFTNHYVIDPELFCQQYESREEVGLGNDGTYFGQ